MQYLYDYNEQDYGTLLAADVLDASKGAMFAARGLKPNTTDRTIFIGLGGTGVRTIDYVKGAISKRLDGTWNQYIAFLGIDASWTELQNAAYLEPKECIQITQKDIQQRMSNEASYPAATHRFMPKGTVLQNLNSDGAGRTRLVGKVKIHDQAPGNMGVDEEVVQRLINIKTALSPLPAGPGKYQIYVIGSVCGGTCSGSVLEMPALIRKAIPQDVQINAMLYLPDTLEALDPQHASQLYANGYATLKELDYFMGMKMRRGYTETWSYNSPAARELTYPQNAGDEGFIDLPYLIGTINGTSSGASQEAMTVIAEYLISLLAEISTTNGKAFLTSAFLSNAQNMERQRSFDPTMPNQREAYGTYHQYPRRYAAIGFAEASAPQKLVRAYTVGKVCAEAGLRPVDVDTRTKLLAAGGNGLVPFRGKDDLLSAPVGTAKAADLLQPLKDIMKRIHSGDFSLARDLNEQDITWKKIREGYFDGQSMVNRTDNYINNQVTGNTANQLRNDIRKAYDAFRKNVQDYVGEEGPYAFANLYDGKFTPVNGDYGMGIGAMLKNLVNGLNMDGSALRAWLTPGDAKNDLDNVRSTITNMSAPLMGIETGKYKNQAVRWEAAYNTWCCARINDKRRDIALGNQGALQANFLLPAAQLAREVRAFGCVVDSLAGIYEQQGAKMSSFTDFQKARDNKTEVNIAAVTTQSYAWLKGEADKAVQTVNAKTLRQHLVDHFFGVDASGVSNINKWLEVPDTYVKRNSLGKVELTNPDVAVPAREIFDELLIQQFPAVLDVSIETMFLQMAQNGTSFDQTAQAVMQQLANQSKAQFNGVIPNDTYFLSIMYPDALRTGTQQGPAIAQALETAANTVFGGQNVHVYASADTDSIMCYQLAAPLEIYRLADLKVWEQHYETGNYGIGYPSAYLHGLSPDIEVQSRQGQPDQYLEKMPWKDYPSIVPVTGDPTKPDPITGKISREGQLRKKLQETVEEAKKLGVLYADEENNQWVIKMVYCRKDIAWQFDLMQCQPDPATGLLPLGLEFAKAVAVQNNIDLDSISEKVRLDCDGVVGKASATEEMAWEYATRTLRFHVPMYERMRYTLDKFRLWAADIQKHNQQMQRQLMPGQMVYMLKAQLLHRNAAGAWELTMANGTAKLIANITPAMVKFLPPRDKKMIDNGLLGYYLFGKLKAALNDSSDAFAEYCDRAKTVWNGYVNAGDSDRLATGEEDAQMLFTEQEALGKLGARLDGDEATAPSAKFANALAAIDPAISPADVDLFYYRINLWQYL